jgi:hypothetical protein
MTDHITKAAKEAGGTTYTNRHYPGETACAFGPEALARFYALAFKAGMERAAEICDRLAGVTAKWPEASEGLTAETKFVRGVGDCMATFGEEIRAEAYAQNPPRNEHDGSVVSKN